MRRDGKLKRNIKEHENEFKGQGKGEKENLITREKGRKIKGEVHYIR